MQWLLPAALGGLVLVGLPLLIHLLSRERPPAQRVPTLRFVDETALAPVQRARVQDPWLLLLRMLLIVLAVLALARPSGQQTLVASAATATAVPETLPTVPVTVQLLAPDPPAPSTLDLRHLRVLRAVTLDPAVRAALLASAAAAPRAAAGLPVVVGADGRAVLGAWSDGTDTLRLHLALATTADGAAARVLQRVIDDAAVATRLEPAAPGDSATLRQGRDVQGDRSPLARILWGLVLLGLLLEWWLRGRLTAVAAGGQRA
jgi:hypothetical protein